MCPQRTSTLLALELTQGRRRSQRHRRKRSHRLPNRPCRKPRNLEPAPSVMAISIHGGRAQYVQGEFNTRKVSSIREGRAPCAEGELQSGSPLLTFSCHYCGRTYLLCSQLCLLYSTPSGVASKAQGWRFAYPGKAIKLISNPNGVAAYSLNLHPATESISNESSRSYLAMQLTHGDLPGFGAWHKRATYHN
jgi:hypothetical protein